MSCAQITRVFDEAIKAAIPESSLTISEWADTYRFLSPERSARPGRWNTDFVPYLRVPMNLLTRPDVVEEVFWKSSQVAGTSFVENVIGFFSHVDPSSILYVCEDEKKAEAWARESFRPMVRDTPVLSTLYGDPKQRDSGNTLTGMAFPGGHLALAWATSPATLSSRPRRIVIFDEMDAFPVTREGDSVKLGEARTRTYPNKKIIKNSSPRNRIEPPPDSPPDTKSMSPIESAYHECRYRGKHFLPCPHCGEYQTLEWARVEWADRERIDAYYACVNGCLIEHEEKAGMLARGKWRFEGKDGVWFEEEDLEGLDLYSVGFFIWEAYSPFTSWGDIAVGQPKKHEVEKLKVWINTRLGQPWDDQKQQAEIGDLTTRYETFTADVPAGALVLVAGVDIQGDRIEIYVIGWGLDEESWAVDYKVIYGDPSQPQIWDELKDALTDEYVAEVGPPMRIVAAGIDTGGHHTEEVYRFCRENEGRRWWAVKGANTPGKPLVSKPTLQSKPPVKLYTIGTETAKDSIVAHLAIREQGPGYCHFPDKVDSEGALVFGEEHFKQLRSEKPRTQFKKGVGVRVWEKIKQGIRNEALDTRVYARAALGILRPDFKALARRRARYIQEVTRHDPEIEQGIIETIAEESEVETTAETQAAAAPTPVVHRKKKRGIRMSSGGGFVRGWR